MQGHIRKRGRDSWTVVVDMGRDPQTGRRRQLWRSVRGTKREAQGLLVELLHQRAAGIDAPPGKVTLAEYLASWLRTYAATEVAPTTFRRYEQLIRVHIAPAIGGLPLGKLRPLHVQGAYTRMLQKGLSARTVVQAHRVLRQALQHALRWQLIPRNPADAAQPPRFERYEPKTLEPAQVRRVLAAADETPYGTLVHTAVATGLRLGELLGLRWQDVDFQAGTLHVRQTCQWLPRQGFIFRQPKSHRSSRPVALSPAVIDRLRERRRQQLEERLAAGPAYQEHALVFTSAVGEPTHPSNLRDAWKDIVFRAGVEGLRFHDLRHAHASLLLKQGVHPKIVSERLGHSSVGITLDIYSHVTPNLQAEAAKGFDRMLANG